MKTYNFTVNGKSQAGTLTWNPNGTLNQLSITDTFNAGGSQTCNYLYDDLGRLGVPPNSPPPPPTPTSYSVDCGSSLWRQVFSYDQYDNLTKTGNPGMSWTTGYNAANNQYIGGSYDSDGHLTYDGTNTYSWDAYGKMIGVRAGATAAVCGTSGSCATYDALGRIVETSTNATYKEYLFGPTGRLVQMSGTSVTEVDLPLPGGPMLKATGANGGGSKIIMHNDWLGTNRLATVLGNRTLTYDTGYAPYGETYDTFGTPEQDFTGDFQDIFTGLFDTPNRELATNASRWLSPDPAGASWNAYAYPTDPNRQTDPTGLGPESFVAWANLIVLNACSENCNDHISPEELAQDTGSNNSTSTQPADQAQNNTPILDVAQESNANLAVNESRTSTTNQDGTVTVTTTTTVAAFSAREGNLNQFLGAATQTNTMTYNPKDDSTVNPGQNGPITPISQAAATKIIGGEAIKRASSAEAGGMVFHTLYGMTQTAHDHPFTVGVGAAQVMGGILTTPKNLWGGIETAAGGVRTLWCAAGGPGC